MSGYKSRKHLRIVVICALAVVGLLVYNDILSTTYLVTIDTYVKSSVGIGNRSLADGNDSESKSGLTGDSDESSGPDSEESVTLKAYHREEQDGNFTFVPVQVASDRLDLELRFNVCLATQTTIDRLATINLLASYWRGPIELVIFLRTFDELAIIQKFLEFTSQCSEGNEWMLRTVNIQLAYTTSMFRDEDKEYVQNITDSGSLEVDCKNPNRTSLITPEELLKALLQQHMPEGPDPKFVYPQNHMRNRAKHACAASFDWVTVMDVDIIPKMDSAQALQEFRTTEEARSCKRCAFVIPIYELAKPCKYPKTKRELVDMAKRKEAIPFHFGFWKPAHEATDYDKWSTTDLDEGPVHISHDSNYKLKIKSVKDGKRHSTYFYEPFHIAKYQIPDYPERFLGFGFTRSTQAFLALVTGWKFLVLSPAFATHCGIQPKVKPEDFKTVPRYQQVQANNKIYKVFIDELLKQYGDKI